MNQQFIRHANSNQKTVSTFSGHDGACTPRCNPRNDSEIPLAMACPNALRTTILHRATRCWRAGVAERVSVGTMQMRRGDARVQKRGN